MQCPENVRLLVTLSDVTNAGSMIMTFGLSRISKMISWWPLIMSEL